MTASNKFSIVAIAAVVVASAAVALLDPGERSFPGFSATEVREIRTAVARYALPRYSQCLSWAGVRYLPKVARIHERWHIDDMAKGADGVVTVRYTVQCSKATISNIVCTVRRQGPAWVIRH